MPEEKPKQEQPSLEEILRKDAASIEDSPHDVRLHQDTMRKIRNLEGSEAKRSPLFAMAPKFGLVLFQAPAGRDVHELRKGE